MNANFVYRPRTFRDFSDPHSEKGTMAYRVVKKISLPKMDYENFSEDLLADRPFPEAWSSLCQEPGQCLRICARKQQPILVIPERSCFVGWAAWEGRE